MNAPAAAPPSAPAQDVQTLTISQETRVGWFDVRQLLATGEKALTSTIIGSMSGRREVMAALDPRPPDQPLLDHDYADHDALWIDYVADTGDGWDASYSVAYLVGRDALYLRDDLAQSPQPIANSGTAEADAPRDAGLTRLPCGEILMLGGDQVYPTASAAAYQGRLQDPFHCARPGGPTAEERHVYAIPGNHDWYDGLTAFIRLFCQRSQRWIGIWRTRQRRSYFAIRIREGWWLWAADLALEDDLDPPQLDYFDDQAAFLKEGDRVILCLPSPTWVEAYGAQGRERPEVSQQANKAALIEKKVRKAKARVVLALAGDLHHYARHEVDDGTQRTNYITCGGGGAFTLGTSRQPEVINLPDSSVARLRARFPSDAESRAMRWWSLLFPTFSPGFTALLATYQILLTYALNSVSRLTHLLKPDGPPPWLENLAHTSLSWRAPLGLVAYAMEVLFADGMTLLFALLMVGGCIGFARSGRAEIRGIPGWLIPGSVHGLLQLIAGLVCCWLAARLTFLTFNGGGIGVSFVIAFVVAAALLIFVINGVLFGAYLLVTNLACGMHEQEVFSCQSIETYKCFLRICVERDRATVYPIGLRRPAQSWKAAPGVKVKSTTVWPNLARELVLEVPNGTTRIFDPHDPLCPQLIEKPIEIR
jgi:hypothetical protein